MAAAAAATAILTSCDVTSITSADVSGDVHVCGSCHVSVDTVRAFLEHRASASCVSSNGDVGGWMWSRDAGAQPTVFSHAVRPSAAGSHAAPSATCAMATSQLASTKTQLGDHWPGAFGQLQSPDQCGELALSERVQHQQRRVSTRAATTQEEEAGGHLCGSSASLFSSSVNPANCHDNHDDETDLLLLCDSDPAPAPQSTVSPAVASCPPSSSVPDSFSALTDSLLSAVAAVVDSTYKSRTTADKSVSIASPPPAPQVSPASVDREAVIVRAAGGRKKERRKRHTCSVCGHQCVFPKDLQRHMFKHKDEKFACSQCDCVYNRPDKLHTHIRLKHARPAHYHNDETAATPAPSGGTQVKHLSCPVPECQHKTTSQYLLQKHLQHTHSDVRPFSCQICSYSAKTQHRLNVHLRTHTGDSPYRCGVCGRVFKTGSDLVRHRRSHSDSKPFSCPHCSFTTAYTANLRVHIRRLHEDNASDDATHTSNNNSATAGRARAPSVGGRGKHRPSRGGRLTGRKIKYLANFACDRCGLTFVRAESHRAHLHSVHAACAGRLTENTDDDLDDGGRGSAVSENSQQPNDATRQVMSSLSQQQHSLTDDLLDW